MQCLLHPTPSPSKCWAPRSGPRAGEHPHLHRTPRHGQYPTFRDTATLTVPHLHGHPNPSSTPPSRTPQHCQYPTFWTPQHCQYSTFKDTPTLPAPPPLQDTPTLPVPHLPDTPTLPVPCLHRTPQHCQYPTFKDTPARPAFGLQTPLESPGLSRGSLTSTSLGRTGLQGAYHRSAALMGIMPLRSLD